MCRHHYAYSGIFLDLNLHLCFPFITNIIIAVVVSIITNEKDKMFGRQKIYCHAFSFTIR